MKKIFTTLFLVLFALSIYFFFKENEAQEVSVILPDTLIVPNDQSYASTKSLEDKASATKKDAKVVEDKLDEVEKLYDKNIQDFNNLVLNLFTVELKLAKSVFDDYLKMREGLAKDKLIVFESFHRKMEEKYGENYSYNPSDEEIQFEKDIQTRYDNLLLTKLGKENFIKYLELRDNFNNNLIENQDVDAGVILMEF